MFGEKLRDQGYGIGLYPEAEYVAVKVPVFSFEKLHDVDTLLGPEMKSTGEVLGIAKTFDEALFKGLVAAGYKMKHEGGVLVTVRDTDKQEVVPIVEKFEKLGFNIYATAGTALTLNQNMIAANTVRKIEEDEPNIMTLFDQNKIDYIITTSKKGKKTTASFGTDAPSCSRTFYRYYDSTGYCKRSGKFSDEQSYSKRCRTGRHHKDLRKAFRAHRLKRCALFFL